LHSPKVELADTKSTLPADVAPVLVATAPDEPGPPPAAARHASPAAPTIAIAQKVAAGDLAWSFTVPDKDVPCSIALYDANGAKLGEVDGLTYLSSLNGVDASSLIPAPADIASGPSSFSLRWSAAGESATATFTYKASVPLLAPGTYRLVVVSGGHRT